VYPMTRYELYGVVVCFYAAMLVMFRALGALLPSETCTQVAAIMSIGVFIYMAIIIVLVVIALIGYVLVMAANACVDIMQGLK